VDEKESKVLMCWRVEMASQIGRFVVVFGRSGKPGSAG